MKNMKTNTIQLIIAGIVVVLVAICGTFAWFAVSESARVNQIGATVVSPSTEAGADSGIGEIQIYDPEILDWKPYEGESLLSFVPGQSYSFKVIFKAHTSQTAFLRLTGIDETNALLGLLKYCVKFTDEAPDVSEYNNFTIEHGVNNEPYVPVADSIAVSQLTPQGENYVVYYHIKLPGEVEKEGFDLNFSAIIELIFQ